MMYRPDKIAKMNIPINNNYGEQLPTPPPPRTHTHTMATPLLSSESNGIYKLQGNCLTSNEKIVLVSRAIGDLFIS